MGLFDTFANPPRDYTIIPFWFLNDDLAEEELIRQIDDFAAHGVYGFIPHARIGLPQSIGFMSERWLHFVKVCVEHAAQNGMYVVLYDEGMYPSGSCAGQVVAANPKFATRCLERRPKGNVREDEVLVAEDAQFAYVNRPSNGHIRGVHEGWDDGEPQAPLSADLLNPEAMACFRRLVLDRSYVTLKDHFGKTVIAVFTDEPDVLGRGHIKDVKPWTWSFDVFLQEYLGYDFRPHLAALWDDAYPDAARYRADFARAVDARLQQVYYAPYSKWCEDHGVALTGHPAGPGDIGVEKFFHIPGQDIVWRYIEPFQDKSFEGDQSTQAKCSVSAQRHYGRSRNSNECYGAYGWEFTEDEMWWVANWLFVRGVNLLYPHAFYYSVRDKRRDERPPDVGPHNVWWDRYKTFADYCRRLSWLMATGRQVCDFAILGSATRLPWRAARVLFEAQRDFNYLDTDTLLHASTVDAEAVRVNEMTYKALIIDGPEYLSSNALRVLKPMIDAGRALAYTETITEIPAHAPDPAALLKLLDAIAPPDVVLSPANKHIRAAHMHQEEGDLYLFANEGRDAVDLRLDVSATGEREWWDPVTPHVITDRQPNRLVVEPYRTIVLHCRPR